MFKNTEKAILCILTISSMVMSQQGEYQRKSVSSLESVWFKTGSVSGMEFDSKTFDKFIDFYVEVDRFDYNVLPSNLLQDFRREANSMDEVTPEALSEVLENTVTSKIVEILNDPDVMQQRGEALKDESAFQSFAATKAKSLGLTVDELKMLMNSAYIYLPFISSATKESEGADDLSITLEGGIIWWQMKMAGDGSTSVEQVLSATTKGMSAIDPTAKNTLTKQSLYNEFKFGSESWKTTPTQYAQNDAMLAFCKNLGVKTKKIDDFKLTAQIAEASGSKYGFPLGHREGVHLDDGFLIVEYEEDSEGNEVAVRKGFVRVSKTGDNVEDPNDYTYAKQLYGSKVSEGTVVMEHPVLGMDARLNLGMGLGANLEAKHTTVPLIIHGAPNVRVLTEDATSMIGGNLVFSYNLAPIINVTQTFLDLDIGFGLPLAAINLDSTSGASFILSPYFGVTKKFSAGRTYTSVGLGGGVDMLSMAGTVEFEYWSTTYSYDYTFAVTAPGVKLFGEFGYLINQDLSLVISGGYKIGLAPVKQMLTLNEVEYELNPAFTALYMPEVDYETLKMGGLSVNIGASYALSELPIDIFGFLDPFKKH